MYINAKTRGNNIYISELNQDYSIDFRIERNYRPELFCDSQDETSEWKDLINNEPLQKITFDNIRDFQDYKKSYKSMGFSGLFNIIEPEYQWIKDNPVTNRFKYRVWHIDIETGIPEDGSFPDPLKTEAPITVIQVGETDTKHKYIFAWLKTLDLTQEDVTYIFCRDERHMLEKYAEFSLIRTPIMTTAWNGDGFDYSYIVNRMKMIGLDPGILSPFGKMEEHRTVIFGKEMQIEKPMGVVWLDFIDMFKKSDPSGKPSWALEFISKEILGDDCTGKVKYQDLGYEDMKDFVRNRYSLELDLEENSPRKKAFQEENNQLLLDLWWEKFIDYSITDVQLLLDMDEKLGLSNMIFSLAHDMKCNIYDVFATIKPWTTKIYNELYSRNIALPGKSPFETYHTVGGHVFAKPGLHRWVISEDYTSLYPFCIISLNLSPETYVSYENVPEELRELTKPFYRYVDDDNKIYMEDIYLKLSQEKKDEITDLLVKHDLVLAPNGSFYDLVKQGILPELTQTIYNKRKQFKKEMKVHENNVELLKQEAIRRGLSLS